MHEVIGNLKNKIILNEKIILDLKGYIYKKFPSYSSKELSLVLADGIHKIINRSMDKFTEKLKDEIEANLVRDAVNKNDFSISAYKVFCQYCKSYLDSDSTINDLYEWLSLNQDKPVIKDELIDFINIVSTYENLSMEDAISSAAELIFEKKSFYYANQTEYDTSQMDSPQYGNNSNIIKRQTRNLKNIFIEFIEEYIHKTLNIFSWRRALTAASILLMLIIILNARQISYAFINTLGTFKSNDDSDVLGEDALVEETNNRMDNGLPEELQYIEINRNLLKSWLENKNSILAEEPYLSSILDTAKQYDINPLFMIAITGQEQGFVPKSQENALKIANNPFNVYKSWVGYNTTIDDSSKIAAQTIINLSKGRPEEAHAIKWINEKYAEDKNWWVGVDKIFKRLQQEIIN